MKYVDPDGRRMGMPMELIQEMSRRNVCVNGKTSAASGITSEAQHKLSIRYSLSEYNIIQKVKANPAEFPSPGMLIQKIDNVAKYPTACIYFSTINTLMMAGYKVNGFFMDLPGCVDSIRGNYTDIIKLIFGVDVIYNQIPSGLDESSLLEVIGDNPAVLIYDQDTFWKNGNIDKQHGLAYYKGTFYEPYLGNKSKIISNLGGKGNECLITDYIGGFYFGAKQNE